MATYRDIWIVLDTHERYSRLNILEALGKSAESPESPKHIKAVRVALDQEFATRTKGACVFDLLAAEQRGQVVIKAIEDSECDHYVANIQQRFPKEDIEAVFSKVIGQIKTQS